MDVAGSASPHAPLIVSLRFDAACFAVLDALRRAHFPPERNVLSAHLTLFHALPAMLEGVVHAALVALAATTGPLPVAFFRVRSLGGGVALDVDAPALVELRARLARRFAAHLTRQDAQGWRPHVTVQNKVDAETARRTFEALCPGFVPWTGSGLGLDLWRSRGGPWEAVASAPFAAGLSVSSSAVSSSDSSPAASAPR